MTDALDREERDAAIRSARSVRALRELAVGLPCHATARRGDAVGLGPALATIHPSAVLRAPNDTRDEMLKQMIADLRVAAAVL